MKDRLEKLIKGGLMSAPNALGAHNGSTRTDKLRSSQKSGLSLEFIAQNLHENREVGVAAMQHGEGRRAGPKQSTVYDKIVDVGRCAMPITRRLSGR
jgi:hypothetical protein